VSEADGVIEAVARVSYGRLISYLSARSGDLASAEDALAGAFEAALRTWPAGGIPDKPEAWLLHAARRRLIDGIRLRRTHGQNAEALRQTMIEGEGLAAAMAFPDERLKLLFVCAHPAIDPRVHTPLMLQVVLGLDAAAIASAFLVPAATMGQRLSRAKTKIRDTRIAFEVPAGPELAPRLFAVLEAIYAAYGHGWEDVDGQAVDSSRRETAGKGLAEEAIGLARMLVELLPEEPEALALLALLQYCEARRPSRRSETGEYVPISAQDTRLWDRARLDEAQRLLAAAATKRRTGRFQLEAAVQSAHVERARSGTVDWTAIALLYEGLVRIAPTFGALVSRAAAVGEARGPAAGLALLEAIADRAMETYQPHWAVRAHLLTKLGRFPEARVAFDAAIRLTHDVAVREFLQRKVDALAL
jgi:RNA polymerase sigma-70 factor (ECF subfamily)